MPVTSTGDSLAIDESGDSSQHDLSLTAALECALRTDKLMSIAHRARLNTRFAENSISGTQVALAAGMSAIEIDIRVTRDGVLLLNHDETLERTTTGSGLVSESSWEAIKGLKLKLSDGSTLTEGPATLNEFLSRIDHSTYLMLDLKDKSSTVPVVNLMIASGREDRAAFIVYDLAQATAVRSVYPQALVALGLNAIAEAGNAVTAPLLGLMGEPMAADETLLTLAKNNGYFVLGGSYVGSPSIEKRLADGDSSVDFQQIIRDGFSMLVANEGDIVMEQLRSAGVLLKGDRCEDGKSN